jgi:aryl-alcohol dehydrogenase-like predicted oxidoreductase
MLPWSPLARGRLTREWDATSARQESDAFGSTLYRTDDADRAVVEAVAAVAKARGVPRAQVALAWVAQKAPVTAPIIGASKPNHVSDAVAALTLDLTTDEIAQLEAPYVPHAVTGFK